MGKYKEEISMENQHAKALTAMLTLDEKIGMIHGGGAAGDFAARDVRRPHGRAAGV